MKINPSMLMLSIANPGLLPLAIEQDDFIGGATSRTINHSHTHTHEHDFKKGAGEELRGIEINKADAVRAYEQALADLGEWESVNSEIISEWRIRDANRKKEELDFYEKKTIEEEEEQKAMLAKIDRIDCARKRRDEIERMPKNFFGEIKDVSARGELSLLKNEIKNYRDNYNFGYSQWRSSLHIPLPWATTDQRISFVRKDIENKLNIALLAANNLHLSRDDILEISRMLTRKFVDSHVELQWIIKRDKLMPEW